ncbi:hypothetical protein F8S13_27035 [Chloroflexia bacterium SDU3-3]|nr:hypothetical protein F8S13_27035 [Chloroflexia bacterium SDU3-3]
MRQRSRVQVLAESQMPSVAYLPQEVVDRIGGYSLDLLVEDHQVILWRQVLPESELIRLRGFLVLLPVSRMHHPHITATHIYMETHEQSLVFIISDATPGAPASLAEPPRFIVAAQKFPQEPFFITTLFHRYQRAH